MLAACQMTSTPARAPVPSPTTHTHATTAALQPADVPAGLRQCPGSGPLAAYLTSIGNLNPALGQKLSAQWNGLQKAGALDAAITLYAADQSSCADELAASGAGESAASVVVAFGDEGEADRTWEAGLLGFAPPAPGEVPPGVIRGKGTGLGDSSWTYSNTPVQLASWRKSVFVALVVVTNLDGTVFRAATAAVDARLN
jgi:hypothetical protein